MDLVAKSHSIYSRNFLICRSLVNWMPRCAIGNIVVVFIGLFIWHQGTPSTSTIEYCMHRTIIAGSRLSGLGVIGPCHQRMRGQWARVCKLGTMTEEGMMLLRERWYVEMACGVEETDRSAWCLMQSHSCIQDLTISYRFLSDVPGLSLGIFAPRRAVLIKNPSCSSQVDQMCKNV